MAKAEFSKRHGHRILIQAAMLAVAGGMATQAYGTATDTWTNGAMDSNWVTPGNWTVSNIVAPSSPTQNAPVGIANPGPGTDTILLNNLNDANNYIINFDNNNLVNPGFDWFASVTAANTGTGSVTLNISSPALSGAVFNVSNGLTFSANASLNLTGTSTLSANGSAVAFGTNSTFTIDTGSVATITQGATFGGAAAGVGQQAVLNVTNGSSVLGTSTNSTFAIGVSGNTVAGYATATVDATSSLTLTNGVEDPSTDHFFHRLESRHGQWISGSKWPSHYRWYHIKFRAPFDRAYRSQS